MSFEEGDNGSRGPSGAIAGGEAVSQEMWTALLVKERNGFSLSSSKRADTLLSRPLASRIVGQITLFLVCVILNH